MGNQVVVSALHPAASRPDFWDQKNQRCMLGRMTDGYAEIFLRTKQIEPVLFDMNQEELSRELRSRDQTPSQISGILRMKFWLEYERTFDEESSFVMTHVYKGVCGETSFMRAIRNPYQLAWILCPPVDYLVVLDEMLQLGLERRRQVLARDPEGNGAKGTFDTKLAELQHKITSHVEERKHGAVTQKIEQTTKELSVQAKMNVPASVEEVKDILDNMTPEQIRAEIEQRTKPKEIEVKSQ